MVRALYRELARGRGSWSAHCRNSTSYRLLKGLALTILEERDDEPVAEEPMRMVVFELVVPALDRARTHVPRYH